MTTERKAMPNKTTERRVNPQHEHSRKILHIYGEKERNGAKVIPMAEWRYYADPACCRIRRAAQQNRAGTSNYGEIIQKMPFADMHFSVTDMEEITAIGRKFDLTINDAVRAVFEAKGDITPRFIEATESAPKIRFNGADETASGSLSEAMGKKPPKAEKAEKKPARKVSRTITRPRETMVDPDDHPLEG